MDQTAIILTPIITLAILIALFLIFRQVVCWYWKINDRIELLTEIRDELRTFNNRIRLTAKQNKTQPAD